MGYYSTWEIGINTDEPDTNWEEVFEGGSDGYGFEFYGGALHSGDDYKWYDSHEDILAISKNHPGTTFTVTRIGEDAENERYQVKNGETIRTAHQEWVWVND